MQYIPFVRIGLLAFAGSVLIACGHQAVQSTALAGTAWKLVEIEGAPPAVAEDQRPSLSLDAAAGRAQGSGGCNRYSGSYKQSGTALQFGPMMQTKIGCSAEINHSEQQFHAVMARVTSLRQRADQLELLGQDGSVLMRLRAGSAGDTP